MITRLDVYFLTFIFSLCTPTQSANLNIDFVGDIPIEELLKKKQIFKLEYDKYEIDNKIDLTSIKDTEVFIFFGIWCHDSQREVPRMLRILHELNIPSNQISLIGLTYKKDEPKNRAKKLKVINTPTFIVFKNNIEIGRIIERPSMSLEKDLSNILKS